MDAPPLTRSVRDVLRAMPAPVGGWVWRQATVDATAAESVDVVLDDVVVEGVRIVAGYVPSADDTVWCLLSPDGVPVFATGLAADGADTGWVTPSFLNGWTDYSGSYPFRYRRLGGVVFLAGLVKSGTVNTNIAVLPAGFRPAWDLYFVSHGHTGSAYVESHWTIQTNGNVRHLSGGNVQVSLAGISFPADA